jgi:hypothetical protein
VANVITPCVRLEFKNTESDRRAYYKVLRDDANLADPAHRVVIPEPESEEYRAVVGQSLEDLVATDGKRWPRVIVVTRRS